MKGFFAAIGRIFKALFRKETLDAIEKYVAQAENIVATIALLTPTRVDDEILAAYRALKAEGIWNPNLSTADKLRALAVYALRQAFPNARDSHLNLAVETAVVAIKDAQEAQKA